MKAKEFVEKLKDIATNYKTLYVMGCFGAPLNEKNKKRYTSNHSYNKKPERTAMIQDASEDTFGFDCVCLLKGVLWGWNGDRKRTYGGATYKGNSVPDLAADDMFEVCREKSKDFSNILPGEAVWVKGHIGAYIGQGLAVECTPKWKNNVQITACNCTVSGFNRRNWTAHGKLPYVEYTEIVKTKKANLKVGDLVEITGDKYYSGKMIPAWVKNKRWYIRSIRGERVVIDKSEDGRNSICSPVKATDLVLAGQNEN